MRICPLCAGTISDTDPTILYKASMNSALPAHKDCMLAERTRADSYARWAGDTWSASLPGQPQ